jgi:hypothetical protein
MSEGICVAFRSPRHPGVYVRVKLPDGFDFTKFRKVDELAIRVHEIANGCAANDLPPDKTSIVAIMVALQCCRDENEWSRVVDLARTVIRSAGGW